MRCQSSKGPDGKRIDLFPFYKKMIKQFPIEKANKYRIFNGYLENVLNDKKSILRDYLIWKNLYYGSYKKHIIKHFRHSWSTTPDHFFDPLLYDLLKSKVRFSGEIIEMFEEKNMANKQNSQLKE